MSDQAKIEPSTRDEPLYNIGVVTRMTGIPVATLRVWERRYGFPSPNRTPGHHRLYTERDMLRLRWVKARIDEGMQTGQAIRAMQHLEREGQLLEAPALSPAPAIRREPSPALAAFRERLTAALLRHDLEDADRVLGDALAPYLPEDVIFEMVGPVFADIGHAWEVNQASVATEHLATHYLRHRLLMWMLSGPPPRPVRPAVLACAPEELHEGSLLMLGALLRRHRWPVAYLGQTVPLSDLASFVQAMKPPVVVVVAMAEAPARALAQWPHWLPEATGLGGPILCYGGRIFGKQPQWRDAVPGVFLGATVREGFARLERLLRENT